MHAADPRTTRSKLFALLFGLRAPVDRDTYFIAGVVLLAIKYAVDAAIVYALTKTLWSPLDYLLLPWNRGLPNHFAASDWNEAALYGALGVWALPFVWIGMSMSMRRCIDAGVPSGFALLFFLPIVKYFMIVPLCLTPSRAQIRELRAPETRASFSKDNALLAGVFAGVAILVLAMLVSVFALEAYGGALFIGAPFVSGFVSAYVLARRRPYAPVGETLRVAIASLFIASTAFLLVAWEGCFAC